MVQRRGAVLAANRAVAVPDGPSVTLEVLDDTYRTKSGGM